VSAARSRISGSEGLVKSQQAIAIDHDAVSRGEVVPDLGIPRRIARERPRTHERVTS
jgi:hypothetical protein